MAAVPWWSRTIGPTGSSIPRPTHPAPIRKIGIAGTIDTTGGFVFRPIRWVPAVYLAQEIRQAFLEQQEETLGITQASQTNTQHYQPWMATRIAEKSGQFLEQTFGSLKIRSRDSRKNEGGGTRTLDPRIKSPLLYRLSYALMDGRAETTRRSLGYCSIDRQLCNWVHQLFFTNPLKRTGGAGVEQSQQMHRLGCFFSRRPGVPHRPVPRRCRRA